MAGSAVGRPAGRLHCIGEALLHCTSPAAQAAALTQHTKTASSTESRMPPRKERTKRVMAKTAPPSTAALTPGATSILLPCRGGSERKEGG